MVDAWAREGYVEVQLLTLRPKYRLAPKPQHRRAPPFEAVPGPHRRGIAGSQPEKLSRQVQCAHEAYASQAHHNYMATLTLRWELNCGWRRPSFPTRGSGESALNLQLDKQNMHHYGDTRARARAHWWLAN